MNQQLSRQAGDLKVIIWATLVSGFISSLVKWGSEVNMPPRVPGEVSPSAAHINAWLAPFGLDSHALDYTYQDANVLGAVTLYHWLFSFGTALIYVWVSRNTPAIRKWWGALFGIIVTVATHGFLIPLLGFRNPAYLGGNTTGWLWNLNAAEFWSEMIGHIEWSFSIEISLIAVLAYFGRPIFGSWHKNKLFQIICCLNSIPCTGSFLIQYPNKT